MFDWLENSFLILMERGGVMMWPLLALSVIAVALVLERAWFFLCLNRPASKMVLRAASRALRLGQPDDARTVANDVNSLYSQALLALTDEPYSDALAMEVLDRARRSLDRFLPTLSTIITAAPMLGILGTVLGIISSFAVLGDPSASTDPRSVSQGIAEALITTATGLVIAVAVLFPYNLFRAQAERALSRLETLAAACGGQADDLQESSGADQDS